MYNIKVNKDGASHKCILQPKKLYHFFYAMQFKQARYDQRWYGNLKL